MCCCSSSPNDNEASAIIVIGIVLLFWCSSLTRAYIQRHLFKNTSTGSFHLYAYFRVWIRQAFPLPGLLGSKNLPLPYQREPLMTCSSSQNLSSPRYKMQSKTYIPYKYKGNLNFLNIWQLLKCVLITKLSLDHLNGLQLEVLSKILEYESEHYHHFLRL